MTSITFPDRFTSVRYDIHHISMTLCAQDFSAILLILYTVHNHEQYTKLEESVRNHD